MGGGGERRETHRDRDRNRDRDRDRDRETGSARREKRTHSVREPILQENVHRASAEREDEQ